MSQKMWNQKCVKAVQENNRFAQLLGHQSPYKNIRGKGYKKIEKQKLLFVGSVPLGHI